MINFTNTDAVRCLRRSENLNGAFKNFLKREVRKGDPAARFVKDLKEIMLAADDARAEGYLAKKLPQFTPYLLGIGGYAHADTLGHLKESIINVHADRFNATFSIDGEKLKVSDEATFKQITKAVLTEIDKTLREKGFEDSAFMQGIVLASVFEPLVLARVLQQAK